MRKKIKLKQKLTKKEKKLAFSDRSTQRIVDVMESAIKDPRVKKEAISIIKTLDLKRIRNTSET